MMHHVAATIKEHMYCCSKYEEKSKNAKVVEDPKVNMATSNLVVPLVLWGKKPPTHCVSSILMTPDSAHLVTGCNDGQICVWDVAPNWQIHPRSMLFGHTTAVTCLAIGSNNPEKPYIVSASDNGEMCLWDLSDGRCVEHTKLAVTHTNIQAYQMMHCRDVRLVCNGYYPEIHVVHPITLEILLSLSSRIQPDWISALCILRPIKREDDVVVAISNSGTVKVWTLTGSESKASQPIYEDEAKQIRCLNAQTLRCCAYNQRTVLIVCSKYWQIYDTTFVGRQKPRGDQEGIYDAGDFSLLCSESSRRGERWAGGEFIGVDRIIVWSNEGKGYLFKLPANANPASGEFRRPGDPSSPKQSGPQAYHILDMYTEKALACSAAMTYFLGRRDRESKLLLRGDSEGRVVVWAVPDIHDKHMKLVRQESFDRLPVAQPLAVSSLREAWEITEPKPEGLIDQLNQLENKLLQVTSTIYIPSQGRLVCGREDGSIVIVPAIQAIVLQLLESGKLKDSLSHRTLQGHNGRVNCLLYPYNDSPRYDANHLVSGGVDFTVCLWDISTGTKLHSFSVHGGEITQLLVPPSNCNPRILPCICSVASDHSLSLLSLRERKCIMLAARQLFPIQTVKWRPLDDFLVIGCTDGTVYVWQMETGHLDRVVHGVTAEEILAACDTREQTTVNQIQSDLTNPTISLAQAFRRRNLATFKNLATQRLQHGQQQQHHQPAFLASMLHRPQAHPMMIQGLRTNTKDPDSHVIFFDTEALIVQLLGEEYATMSPGTLEAHGFISQISTSASLASLSDPQKKLAGILSSAKDQNGKTKKSKRPVQQTSVTFNPDHSNNGFIAKVKDKAENVGQKIQAKAESAGFKPISPRLQRHGQSESPTPGRGSPRPHSVGLPEGNLTMEIAQVFMSCLHAWGQDPDLDKLCLSKLGLLCPKTPIAFGLLSRGGHMSLLLPGWHRKHVQARQDYEDKPNPSPLTRVIVSSLMQATAFVTNIRVAQPSAQSTRGHWQISTAVTTQHLLSVISVANTLMSMNNATFIANVKMSRKPLEAGSPAVGVDDEDGDSTQQAQTKQGWSLLAALHCVLLPDLIGKELFQPPQLEMLARRWQDRCLEIREAAQALLLAELRRTGPDGRKQIVDEWSPYLPSYVDPALSILAEQQQAPAPPSGEDHAEEEDDDEDHMLGGDSPVHRVSQSFESRRKQATAIVMMGVLGAEFGQEMEPSKHKTSVKAKNVVEGFGLTKYSHAMHTSKALTFLLLQPPSQRLPAYTPIRRASIDLLGRGFTVWEPYLDVSSVLLGLLELCVDSDRLVPSMTFGLPLSPQADACRTSRHALSLIATARPPAFIITMAKEVARYNAMVQNTQTPHHQLNNSVLVRARPEIIRILELLVEKIPNDVVDLLVEVMDVTVHCLDPSVVKSKGLQEVFPAICRFSMVSYCASTKRICVGAKNGGVAFYELKQSKCQVLPAHKGQVIAVSFSPDGKFLASFSHTDSKLCFWQTGHTSIFGIGSQQTRCVKTIVTPAIPFGPNTNLLKLVRLIWVDARTVVLLTVDGVENKYRV